uniref:Uncharacterized protein n=1 Tax=Arundo donax TaxID=35708 RepID=A0A0A9D1U6_ARUDO
MASQAARRRKTGRRTVAEVRGQRRRPWMRRRRTRGWGRTSWRSRSSVRRVRRCARSGTRASPCRWSSMISAAWVMCFHLTCGTVSSVRRSGSALLP